MEGPKNKQTPFKLHFPPVCNTKGYLYSVSESEASENWIHYTKLNNIR